MSVADSRESTATDVTEVERAVRIELAAAYRLAARFGMSDLIYTHFSARVPGERERFLLNPYGLLFEEITASSLVKVGPDGEPVEPGGHEVNPAGFTIHGAVHAARSDVCCVMHTHTTAGMAVAASRDGLLPISQMALQFYGRIGYHDYEGIALDPDECGRLARDLDGHQALILRNHGLLTAGGTVAEAFSLMHYLHRACEIQVAAKALGEVLAPPLEVCEHTARQYEREGNRKQRHYDREWSALVRMLDREDPRYRD